jgi:hypothetical protein
MSRDAPTADSPTADHDVFVSYRHQEPDRSWVRTRLVPALRRAGLDVCLDIDTFRLGAPLILEMGRAVERSRYTLLVLSPAYLDSGFTEFESVLAEHLGLEERAQRLIVVLRAGARPRLSLRARLWLDMTDDATFPDDIARIAAQPGLPASRDHHEP